MNNEKNIKILLGRNYYPLEIEAKPSYRDSSGNLCMKSILVDLAEKYKGLSDDDIIQKLKVLKNQYTEADKLSNRLCKRIGELDQDDILDNDACALQEYEQALDNLDITYDKMVRNLIDRQILTNAFALNNGASPEDIVHLSSVRVFFHDFKLDNVDEKSNEILSEYLYEDYCTKYDLIIDLAHSLFQFLHSGQIIRNSNYLPTLSQIAEKQGLHVVEPNDYPGIEELGNIFKEFANLYLNNCWPSEQVTSSYFLRVLYGKIDDMKSKLQFPPYGVALAFDYEDEGQRVLPWSGNLSDKAVMKYRKIMHDYAGKDKSKVFQAILGAYCNGFFNDIPVYKQASLEFSPVTFSASTYSDYVTKKIMGSPKKKGFCRFLEYGYSRYGNLEEDIKDENFFLIYKELKDAWLL